MIKYLGSKRTLVPAILDAIGGLRDVRTVLDPFSGTSRVGLALKQRGCRVMAADCNAYAAALARCYVEADDDTHRATAERELTTLRQVPPRAGYFTETFCVRSRFVHPRNGERVDAMREEIERRDLPEPLRSVVLVALMEAADRVDSTTGVQMAYLKDWAPRAFNDLELRMPELAPRSPHGACQGVQADVFETLARAPDVDVAYLDPPYNQHSYLGNYHVWESLVRWDKPEVYGIACKRVDVKERRSVFNSKRAFKETFRRVVQSVRARHLVVSFNDEGFLTRDELVEMLSARGKVRVHAYDYRRYVGAQIGIYNPRGEKVGRVSHLRNQELLFVV